MENTPDTAPTTAPAEASDKTPTTTNPEPTQTTPSPTVDLGLTAEQAEKFKIFIDNSGGFDNAFKKLKTDISQPKAAEKPVENPQPQPTNEPTSHTEAQPVEQLAQQPLPKGARTNEDLMAEYYFRTLSERPEYAAISKDIREGNVLAEMDRLGINYRYSNGAWDDERINEYLKLKAQTIPAKPTETEPNASAAPTVTYTEVGDQIANIDQAYKVIMEKGHPQTKMAEEYIKNYLNKH